MLCLDKIFMIIRKKFKRKEDLLGETLTHLLENKLEEYENNFRWRTKFSSIL